MQRIFNHTTSSKAHTHTKLRFPNISENMTHLRSFSSNALCCPVTSNSTRRLPTAINGRIPGPCRAQASEDDARRNPNESRRRRRSSNLRGRSGRGKSFESSKRRRGRPAYTRSPDDSPLRDGNRDRLMGLLTKRAARTLCYYLMETNPNVYQWFEAFMKENPIPTDGSWDDVSGETFLRKLLSMPIEAAKYSVGRDPMYDCFGTIGVDPRNIAQRTMEIRTQLATEFIQDLSSIGEENSQLLRETLHSSLMRSFESSDEEDM